MKNKLMDEVGLTKWLLKENYSDHGNTRILNLFDNISNKLNVLMNSVSNSTSLSPILSKNRTFNKLVYIP
jgi:hypothetical protein